MKKHTRDYVSGLITQLESLPSDKIRNLVKEMENTSNKGGFIYIAGNGGSAATASHFVCDIKKTVLGSKDPHLKKKGRFRVMSLNDNMPLLTAWANDYTYDEVFSQPLLNLGTSKDMLIVITGSGNSKNILRVLEIAKEIGLRTFGLLGFDGGKAKDLLDDHIIVETEHYGHIEDVHMILVHLITEYIKKNS